MGRPSRTATTTRCSSEAERKKPAASSSTRRPPSTRAPAGSSAWAVWTAWAISPIETDSARRRSGSGSIRIARRAPPRTETLAVRGTSASSLATSSPSLRSSPAGSGSSAWSVRVRNGTSSMVRARTMGFIAVGGSGAGHGDDDVHHRDDDLRLLLARREGDGGDAEADRGEDDDGRELGAEERLRHTPGEPEARLSCHGPPRSPARRGGRRARRSRGPPARGPRGPGRGRRRPRRARSSAARRGPPRRRRRRSGRPGPRPRTAGPRRRPARWSTTGPRGGRRCRSGAPPAPRPRGRAGRGDGALRLGALRLGGLELARGGGALAGELGDAPLVGGGAREGDLGGLHGGADVGVGERDEDLALADP